MLFIIVVSNPLDAMTQVTFKRRDFENRVMGMAGVLDWRECVVFFWRKH